MKEQFIMDYRGKAYILTKDESKKTLKQDTDRFFEMEMDRRAEMRDDVILREYYKVVVGDLALAAGEIMKKVPQMLEYEQAVEKMEENEFFKWQVKLHELQHQIDLAEGKRFIVNKLEEEIEAHKRLRPHAHLGSFKELSRRVTELRREKPYEILDRYSLSENFNESLTPQERIRLWMRVPFEYEVFRDHFNLKRYGFRKFLNDNEDLYLKLLSEYYIVEESEIKQFNRI